MAELKTTLKMVGGIFVGIILFALICLGIGTLITKMGDGGFQYPVKKLTVSIEIDQRDEVFKQLEEFARQHSLSFNLSDYGNGDYLVEILGSDMEILAVISSPDPEIMSVGFYATSPGAPPPDEKIVDNLVVDLKNFLNEIPNVTITENIKSFTITIEENRNQEVHSQLQKFSEKHDLEFTLSFSSDKSLFDIAIYGEGFHVTGENRLHAHGVDDIDVIFYTDTNNEALSPAPISQQMIVELVDDLRSLLNEIPNVTIVEE